MNRNRKLLVSIQKGNIKKVDSLLHSSFFGLLKPADVNYKGYYSPLNLAVHYALSEIATLLIEKGAKFDIETLTTAIDSIWRSKNEKIINFLLSQKKIYSKINEGDEYGRTSLHFAAYSGDIKIVTSLLNKNANPNLKSSRYTNINADWQGPGPTKYQIGNGGTPLHEAVLGSNKDIVVLLIEKGADINAENNERCTPLHIAAAKESKSLVNFLIQKKAKLYICNESGYCVNEKGCLVDYHKKADFIGLDSFDRTEYPTE